MLVVVGCLTACSSPGGGSVIDEILGITDGGVIINDSAEDSPTIGSSAVDEGAVDATGGGDDTDAIDAMDNVDSVSDPTDGGDVMPTASLPPPGLDSTAVSGTDADNVAFLQGDELEDYTMVVTNETQVEVVQNGPVPAPSWFATLAACLDLTRPAIAADFDTTDADPCNDCDATDPSCAVTCVEVKDGKIEPTALYNVGMDDTLSFYYYDPATDATSEMVTDRPQPNITFLQNSSAPEQAMANSSKGLFQVSDTGNLTGLKFTGTRYQVLGRADNGYRLASLGKEVQAVFTEEFTGDFIFKNAFEVASYRLQADTSFVPTGHSSAGRCNPEGSTVGAGDACRPVQVKIRGRGQGKAHDVYYSTAYDEPQDIAKTAVIRNLYDDDGSVWFLNTRREEEKALVLENVGKFRATLGFDIHPVGRDSALLVVFEGADGLVTVVGRGADTGHLSLLCEIKGEIDVQDVLIYEVDEAKETVKAIVIGNQAVGFFDFALDETVAQNEEDCLLVDHDNGVRNRLFFDPISGYSYAQDLRRIFILSNEDPSASGAAEKVSVVQIDTRTLAADLPAAIDLDGDGVIEIKDVIGGKRLPFRSESLLYTKEGKEGFVLIAASGIQAAITVPLGEVPSPHGGATTGAGKDTAAVTDKAAASERGAEDRGNETRNERDGEDTDSEGDTGSEDAEEPPMTTTEEPDPEATGTEAVVDDATETGVTTDDATGDATDDSPRRGLGSGTNPKRSRQ